MTDSIDPKDSDRRRGEGMRGRDEALVGRLVQLAETGPSPSAAAIDQAKERLRPLWRREVLARRRRLALLGAGTLAAAAMLLLVAGRVLRPAPVSMPAAGPVAAVTTVVGRADVTPLRGVRARWGRESVGEPLAGGTLVETGPGDRMAVRLAGGQSLRLDVASRIRLDAATAVSLEAGAVYVDSGAAGDGIVVRTPLGAAREVGTQFEVRLAGSAMTVRVREGLVMVSRGDEGTTVGRGFAVTMARGGTAEPRPLATWAGEWLWTQDVAPLLDIEGRTAGEYLDWVGREGGLVVAFADGRAEQVARSAVLHGTLLGPAPLDTLAVVLPGCGLTSRSVEGRLLVSVAGPPA